MFGCRELEGVDRLWEEKLHIDGCKATAPAPDMVDTGQTDFEREREREDCPIKCHATVGRHVEICSKLDWLKLDSHISLRGLKQRGIIQVFFIYLILYGRQIPVIAACSA